ncbi:DUF1826 domain-containing protein (plasmid) [Azospirillum humicireducens]|uniref:DUF1826 domain-containing protein n=1 Tax=Azospirillum humicireducens TaxID=1226968 RepID=A0A2R4VT42_9PROT|nr:DUF1826 domain-containing protein [Azospirillum humicireducens]AWB07620.1 DUF1826 domain-containing protein [Azospirillum humicireducens]
MNRMSSLPNSLVPLTTPHPQRPRADGHVALGRTSCALSASLRSDVTLAVWQRRLPAGIAAQCARLGGADRPSFRLATTAEDVAEDLAAALPSRWIEGPLLRDIVRLVQIYTDIVGCPAIRLRLDSVADDGCRFFHVDHVGLRLLCTYQGSGTHWLPDGAVTRSALGRGDNDAVLPDHRRVRALRAGHVALLKGEEWPGNRGRGLVHRSPPADPSGAPRLLLCLDHDDH